MFSDGVVWWLLGVCCLISCSLSVFLMLNHRQNYSEPILQRKIISILWMVPIYSIEAWLSLRFPRQSPLMDMVRDCYEAYVLYIFFALCLAYIGMDHASGTTVDPEKVHRVLQDEGRLPHPPPFDRCLPPVNLLSNSQRFITRCKRNILQFVLVKPLCTFTALILVPFGRYKEGEMDLSQGYVYLAFLDNVSVTLSLYYLVMFYMATQKALAPFSPLPKFVCVKFIVFFSWWQGVGLAALCGAGMLHGTTEGDQDYTCSEYSTSIQNFLIQVEMLILAVAHVKVFSAAPFKLTSSRPAGQPLAALLPVDRRALREDLGEVVPSVLPPPFRPPVAEHRLYNPPLIDPSPLPSTPKGVMHVGMAAMPGGDHHAGASKPAAPSVAYEHEAGSVL